MINFPVYIRMQHIFRPVLNLLSRVHPPLFFNLRFLSLAQSTWARIPSQTMHLLRLVLSLMTDRGVPGSQVEGLSHHLLHDPFNWRCWGLNLGLSVCKADFLSLNHDPFLEQDPLPGAGLQSKIFYFVVRIGMLADFSFPVWSFMSNSKPAWGSR